MSVNKHNNANETRPSQVRFDVHRYPLAPEGLELQQVHVFMRHGERTPVNVRLSDPPASLPSYWPLCKMARQFYATVSAGVADRDQVGVNQLPTRFMQSSRLVEKADGTTQEGVCLQGELTDIGRQSTYLYGVALRKLYIEKLGFLPDLLRHEVKDEVYFRSTSFPRTIESLHQAIHGLYPSSKCPDFTPSFVVRRPKDENLLENSSCKRLAVFGERFTKAAALEYNPKLESLSGKIAKYLGGKPLRVDGTPSASGILDTMKCAVAHDVSIPAEFKDESMMTLIEEAVVNEWFKDKTDDEVRRLGMGRLLGDLSRTLQTKAQKGDEDKLKFLLHSAHDITMAGICASLDVYDDKWPPFTASITFELFKRKATEKGGQENYWKNMLLSPFRRNLDPPDHYVRMRYQNKNMVLPVCGAAGNHLPGHPEFCTLAAFKERIKQLTPVDWDAECREPLA